MRGWLALIMVALAVALGGQAQPEWGGVSDLRAAPVVLLLIEDPGCPYCARWDRDVREGYLKSEEGRFAPLARRFRGSPDVAFIPNVIYSPTFVVLTRGHEVGRIVGYQGEDFFWASLAGLLAKAGFKPGQGPA